MSSVSRIVCRMGIKRVADRRVRLVSRTVPQADVPFSEKEWAIFRALDRRGRPQAPSR